MGGAFLGGAADLVAGVNKQTRGERNNNPGNIREIDGVQWKGERATDDDKAFEEFDTPEDGIRALAKILLNYQRKHGLRTVNSIINRWAPSNENDTLAYVDAVSRQMGVLTMAEIDLESSSRLFDLVKAIIRHENGRVVYSDQQIEDGIERAYG